MLARQIEAGAPADVFFSADEEWMDYLEQRALLRGGSRHGEGRLATGDRFPAGASPAAARYATFLGNEEAREIFKHPGFVRSRSRTVRSECSSGG